MREIPGVVTGIVDSLDDPDSLGRVRLSFPWMSDSEPLSNWARIAVPMSGAERGIQFMPEEGDEVLVAFEQGNLRFPYVIGFLWNGQDLQPRPKPAQRVIKTVSGHVLEFDDTEGSEKISLLFRGGPPGITISSDDITIDFDGTNVITLSSSGININGGDITIEGGDIGIKGGAISIEGDTIDLNA